MREKLQIFNGKKVLQQVRNFRNLEKISSENKSFSDESKKILNKFISSNTLKNAGIFFYVFSNDIKNIVGDFELKIKAKILSKKTAEIYVSSKDKNSILNNRSILSNLLSKKVLASMVNKINNKDVSINLDPFIETENQWFKSKSNEGLRVPIGYSSDKKLDFNIWYDSKNNIIVKVEYNRLGKWQYILKKIE